MNEIELTEKAISGSRDAFCDLYDLYRVRLYRYAYYRLHDADDAEDAVSSCVLSAWAEISRLKEPGAFPAWIFRILKGACADIIKTQIAQKRIISLDPSERPDKEQESDTEAACASQAEGSGSAPDPELSAILMEAFGTLDEESREMVLLSVVGGLTGSDISEIYGMPQGTVRSRLSRSFAAMRKLMEAGNEQ